ncbi:MAG: hpaD [Ramlibacter sp.]|nr:hpaD [Ramlibacter sp.]
MGKVALAAKITHVPSMYLSGVDTIVVFDTHWLVNANYHINCGAHFKGLYTSNELPHFISNMAYEFPGNPELGKLLAEVCNDYGVETLAHERTTLAPEYGTLVPMRYMNADQHFKVVSVSALCQAHYLNDSARLDAFKIWSPFLEALDHEVVRMWEAGEWEKFCGMLPEYAAKGHGEGFMHDTAMLLGALGWSEYDGRAEVVTPYFGASGTGQINAVFPVTPVEGDAIPKAQASSADGYTHIGQRL